MPKSNWYDDTLCKIHFDMHTPGGIENVGSRFDPQEFASALKNAGAEAVCFFARCAYGWSYYPTKIGFPHPNLSRDLFGDGLKALKNAGLRVIAYMAMCAFPTEKASQYPQWIVKMPDGSTFADRHVPETVPACASRYPGEHLIPQMLELASMYDVDGFFLDGVYHYLRQPCHCDNCKFGFGDYTGNPNAAIPIDESAKQWPAWHAWQRERISDLWGDASAQVANAKEGCLVGVNWLGDVRWSVPPPPSIGYLTGDPPMINCTFESLYHGAAWSWRGVPFDIMNQRMLINWQDFTTRTPESIETDFAFEISGGGKLFIGDLLTPEQPHPDAEVLSVIARGFHFANVRRESLEGFAQTADVAILSSPESIRGAERRWMVDDSPIRGSFLSIMEAGLTADILFDADAPGNLHRYKTLVIPEQRFLQSCAVDAVRSFVKSGGGLVVTGSIPRVIDTGADEKTASQTEFEEILGVKAKGMRSEDIGYLLLRGTDAEDLWRIDDESRPPVSVRGNPSESVSIDAQLLAPLTVPGPVYQIGARPPAETTGLVGVSCHSYGAGKALFCSLPLSADFWNRGNPGAKYVLQGMIRRVTTGFSATRIGPSCVTMRIATDARRTVIHLASFQPDHRQTGVKTVESPAEIHGVKVVLRDTRSPATVTAIPGSAPVSWKTSAGALEITAPPFLIHTALIIEWPK